jgi:hypothetical protein
MTTARRGEIALLLLKRQLREKGVPLSPKFRREMGNLAKELDLGFDEVEEFTQIMVQELLVEVFPTMVGQLNLFEQSAPEVQADPGELQEYRD